LANDSKKYWLIVCVRQIREVHHDEGAEAVQEGGKAGEEERDKAGKEVFSGPLEEKL